MDFCIKNVLRFSSSCTTAELHHNAFFNVLVIQFWEQLWGLFFKQMFGATQAHGHLIIMLHAVLKRKLTLFDTNFEWYYKTCVFFISLLSSTSSGGIIQRQCQGWFIIKTFFSNYPGYLEREATLRSNCNCNRATLFFAHLLTINNRF